MSTSESLLTRDRTRGWRMGLGNMLGKEVAAWWRTRRWWIQCLAGLLLLNGTLALNLQGHVRPDNAAQTFLMMAALCVPVAAIMAAQDSILGEKHSGTAAWVLSKPLRRPAFLLAKLVAHALGLLVAWVVVPGALAYFQLSGAKGLPLDAAGYAKAMGLYYLNLLFYLTLALVLATLFDGRGLVLGISLIVAWSGPMQFIVQPIQKYAPWLELVLPWRLLMDIGRHPALAPFLAMGQRLPAVTPIIATALWSVLFVGVAIWRFRRDEF